MKQPVNDITPLVEYLEKETSPALLADRLVAIQHRYAIAALKDNDTGGDIIADDLVELQMLYERLVRICEINNICR